MEGAQLRKIFLSIIVAIALAVVALAILERSSSQPRGVEEQRGGSYWPETRSEVKENYIVPEINSDVPENVARPSLVAPAAQNTEAKLRIFNIQANANKFSPDTIIVDQDDTVHINVSAVDRAYDFFEPHYGVKQIIKRGENKPIQFQALVGGRFTFFCQGCGGPERGPVGYLIIVPEK